MTEVKKKLASSVVAGISWARMYAILEEAFNDKQKAEVFLQALAEAVVEYKDELATKDDIEIAKLELKREITEVRKEIEQIRAELLERIEANRVEIERVRAEVEKMRSGLLKWIVGLFVPVYLGIVGTLLGIFVL